MRYCVIMCGGVGSRFWPLSRQEKPKQFLDFFGTGKSLLQMTFERILPIVPAERIIFVTNETYAPLIREQIPEIPVENILLEPARRNTAPCICWAAHHIFARDPEASIATLPSDHIVLKENIFIDNLKKGFDFVEQGDRLLTLGICPHTPHTGYGYIQKGTVTDFHPDFMKVKSFTEKPNLEMAELFLQSGEFFWNAGIFLWSAKSILKAFAEYAPEMASAFDAGKDIYGTPEEKAFIDTAFPLAPAISIDYAIMEKASNVYVETVDIGWSDVGSWKAFYDISPKNADGNVTQNCKVLAPASRNNVFASEQDKIIVAVGLEDYIIADTEKALLICPISEEQKVRQIVNDIKTRFGDNSL